MSLRERIWDDKATIESIGTYLDGLGAAERLAETRTLGRDDQRRLYQKAADARPLDLDDFVPAGTAARKEIIHDGRNTLPLPGGLKLFQKRFCRPESGGGRLFGYNESPFVSTIGPGFFVAVPTAGNADWEKRGAIVIDYFQVPDGPVADGWPKVVPNSKGLQVFVYNKTRDFMRRVSQHVSIGAAYKVEKALDHYFILCRQG
ncbi:MAG: hypothetical protein QM820_05355 [Minicystis sp.]